MLEEVSELIGIQVYTNKGTFLAIRVGYEYIP